MTPWFVSSAVQTLRVRTAILRPLPRVFVSKTIPSMEARARRKKSARPHNLSIADERRKVVGVDVKNISLVSISALRPETSGSPFVAISAATRPTGLENVLATRGRRRGAPITKLVIFPGWLPHADRLDLTGAWKEGDPINWSKRGDVNCHLVMQVARVEAI